MKPEEPVSRIMTETVVAIESDRPLSEAIDCLAQHDIHQLPVLRGGKLAGMLAIHDIPRFDAFASQGQRERVIVMNDRFRIEQFMRSPARSLPPHASVADAAELLIESGAHAVPVVDAGDHVIGIVSTTDIMRCLLHGPPRRGLHQAAGHHAAPAPMAGGRDDAIIYRKPTAAEFHTALETAEALHVEVRDPRYLGKAMLYLRQRVEYLERVLVLADRFLHTGQDEHTHALLLKAVLAAKNAEEHAMDTGRVPFPLQ